MAHLCISRHHDVLLDIFYIRLILRLHTVLQLYKSLRMSQSRRSAEDKRAVEFLAQLEGFFKQIFCLCTVRRFYHRNLSCTGHHPCILLILRTVQTRIVCDNDDKSAVYSHIGHGIERIRSHVQSYMLHTCHGADARKTCPHSHLGRHFLVRRPFFIYIVPVLHQVFTYLRTGCSRICG